MDRREGGIKWGGKSGEERDKGGGVEVGGGTVEEGRGGEMVRAIYSNRMATYTYPSSLSAGVGMGGRPATKVGPGAGGTTGGTTGGTGGAGPPPLPLPRLTPRPLPRPLPRPRPGTPA